MTVSTPWNAYFQTTIMSKTQITGIPETMEQAVLTLTEFYAGSLPEILTMSLQGFVDFTHYGAGMFIRNSWYPWWSEGRHYEHWPKQKPALVECFNNLGIVHPDDLSGILMTSFYRSVHNLPLAIDEQVEYYKAYWRGQCFEDGIPKY